MVAFFYFPATFDSVRTLGQAPFRCWPRPRLNFRCSPEESWFFHGENLASCWGLILWFSRGHALEILVKQHEEMSLFIKHVADKHQFPVFLWRYGRHRHAYALYGVFPKQSRCRHFGGVSERKKLARTTWPETHQPREIMRPMDKATAGSFSVQSFATGHGDFVIGSFNTRARNGLSLWD